MENAYKILDIIKVLKSNHMLVVAMIRSVMLWKKYGFENSTTENYLNFFINGFIAPVSREGKISKISYRLVAARKFYVRRKVNSIETGHVHHAFLNNDDKILL